MTDIELVLNMLAEVSTTAISKQQQPQTFNENKKVANRGGQIAKSARTNIENELGHSIISKVNANTKDLLDTKNSKLLSNKEDK